MPVGMPDVSWLSGGTPEPAAAGAGVAPAGAGVAPAAPDDEVGAAPLDDEDAAEECPIKWSHSTSPAIVLSAPAPAVFASPGRNSIAQYLKGLLSI